MKGIGNIVAALLLLPAVFLAVVAIWRDLPEDSRFWITAGLLLIGIVLVFFRRHLRLLTALAMIPAGLTIALWGATELPGIWSDRAASIPVGIVTVIGLLMLWWAWRVLRPLLGGKHKPPKRPQMVPPPVVQVVQGPVQQVEVSLPDALAHYLSSQ